MTGVARHRREGVEREVKGPALEWRTTRTRRAVRSGTKRFMVCCGRVGRGGWVGLVGALGLGVGWLIKPRGDKTKEAHHKIVPLDGSQYTAWLMNGSKNNR